MDEPPIGGIPPFVSAALMLWQLVSVSLPLECHAARHSNGKLTDTNCHSINAALTNGGIPPIGGSSIPGPPNQGLSPPGFSTL